MILADVSIRRPVFAGMMIAAIMVVGVVMFLRLSVDMFPKVDFPIVTVTVLYPGADPATLESKVVDPIEEAVNSLSGIKMLRSISLESVAQVFIQFELDVDLATATQDVRDRVASVQRQMPEGAEPPVVEKLDVGAAPIMHVAVSGPAGEAALSRFAEDVLKPGLEGVRGVGQLELVGSREREMHVWIDPERLRAYGITVLEVVQALGAQNLDVPGGRLTRGGQELSLRTNAQARSAEQLADLALVGMSGSAIRLGDVATVEDGQEEGRSRAFVDGSPALALVVRKQSDANTVEVAERVRAELPRLQGLAPSGTKIEVLIDNSTRIRNSIETVQLDLVLGAMLAVAIIFVFLRDPRATFISALALPTSVIGTFAFIKAMGFTINMMTTLALSLSIGILIDDAIVVIENIVRHRTEKHESARAAASKATAEIGLAVLATTFSIVAVFIPVAFMQGMIGQFFYEFGLTVAFAVLLSLFVSFTLTPMLSARLLKEHAGEPRGLSAVVEAVLRWIDARYRGTVSWALRHRFITMAAAVLVLIGSFALLPMIGFEFMPIEDASQFSVKLEMPTGTALDTTTVRATEIAARLEKMPGVRSTFSTVGGGAQGRVNAAEVIVTLVKPPGRAFGQEAAMAHVRRLLANERGIMVAVEPMQMISSGAFRAAPIQYNLRGTDLAVIEKAGRDLAAKLRETPGFVDVDVSSRPGVPQVNVDLDRDRAADLGVPGAQVAMTVRSLVAGQIATQFEEAGDRYPVRVQLPPALRRSTVVVERAQVRSPTGVLLDVGTIASVREGTGPSQIDRESRQRQVTVLASLEDKPLGDALTDVDRLAKQVVPAGVTTAVSGFGQVFQESVASMGFALVLAIVFIYMILAAQFESLLHPFTIMMSLPFSLAGAFGGLLLTGMRMSIFAMIGLIMLMGLVTKNAILLVDFANQLRARGQSVTEALVNAGVTRLRPILMTTAAMVFGMLPVAIGHGEGGEVRAPMGVTVIGGLITSTFLTLVVVPVVYTFVEWFASKIRGILRWIAPAAFAEEKPEEAATA